MSAESAVWLNQNVLIGNTAQRGKAWHYREAMQGDEPNHYDGPIPLGDVQRRLFHWQAEPRRVAVEVPAADFMEATHFADDGAPMKWVVQTDRQGMVRSDDQTVMGLFKDGYKPHQYDEWLLQNVATILDDDLSISAAGLLRKGAQAWVEVSVPETMATPEGVSFRPNLLAVTSFDGSLATCYKRTVQLTVCDNTMRAALGEKGQQFKVKHSRNSLNRVSEVREALNIVHTMADDFAAQVAELCEWVVTDDEFVKIIEQLAPKTEDMAAAAKTRAENKQHALWQLWRTDERVQPWAGSAFGVVQAVNTYEHHVANVRGADRVERNMEKAVRGFFDDLDANTLALVGANVKAKSLVLA
jgi:phage/plasmid-like protein (TIGR03299 family)